MLSFRQVLVLGAGILSLTACTGEVMQSQVDRPGVKSYFAYGARSGEMLAVVVGNPFPVSKPVVDQAVTDAMQGKNNGPVTRFTTQPGPDVSRAYRVVMAFNTPKTFPMEKLCGDTAAIPSKPTGDNLQLSAGYCVGDALYSHAKIRIPATQSPDDPRFRHMVASATQELVPLYDPLTDGDSCRFPNC